MPTKNELRMLQALPLELKVMRTKQRIRERRLENLYE